MDYKDSFRIENNQQQSTNNGKTENWMEKLAVDLWPLELKIMKAYKGPVNENNKENKERKWDKERERERERERDKEIDK